MDYPGMNGVVFQGVMAVFGVSTPDYLPINNKASWKLKEPV
jgi:hypothetical protein